MHAALLIVELHLFHDMAFLRQAVMLLGLVCADPLAQSEDTGVT